jgi:HEPN domain-containing protein
MYLQTANPSLRGMKNLQNMPMAKWIWLVMSDFDISVNSFELSRPAYHLSLWHSFQALEKLLKAVLFAKGETECSVRKYNHDVKRLLEALSTCDVMFSERGSQIVDNIYTLVGGPSVRYLDDSYQNNERISLASKAIEAHHLLLEFLAIEGKKITSILMTNPLNSITTREQAATDQELRKKVHFEHKQMCGHSAYSKPKHSLPLRQDITHPVRI